MKKPSGYGAHGSKTTDAASKEQRAPMRQPAPKLHTAVLDKAFASKTGMARSVPYNTAKADAKVKK